MALTEIQSKYVGFIAPFAKKCPDPWLKGYTAGNRYV